MNSPLFKVFAAGFLLFCLASCSTVPVKTIDLESSYSWSSEKFELNPQNQSFSAEGDVTMWIKSAEFKGKFTGDYEILSSDSDKWRIIITGPFNISVATVIINGQSAYIFHNGKWDSKPWDEISGTLFNANVDGNLFSVVLGGRFKFNGECSKTSENSRICKMNDTYYKLVDSKVVEILSGELYTVKEKGKWIGVRNGRHAFIFKNKKLNNNLSLNDSLFSLPLDEPDEFEDL
ncbi:MAG: hypothetical protein ACOX2F_07740 [bacterium]